MSKTELTPSEHKSFPFIELKMDEDKGIVEHLIAIHGVLDHGNDISHPGSFAKTLAERGLKAKVLDKHRTDSVMAVVGKPLELREIGRDELPAEVLDEYPEATGAVKATTQFLIETPEGKGVFQRIKAGAVDEFSYGYDPITYDHEDVISKGGEAVTARNLREVKFYEYSPVIWGMNPATGTLSAKDVKEYECECLECGHTMTSDEHCKDIKCPECGGEMRRAERPGPGKELVLRCPSCGYETSAPIELDDLLTCPECGAEMERVTAKEEDEPSEEEKVEVGENHIHVPAPGQQGKHKGHRIRTKVLSESEGIQMRYCGECKVAVSYLFDKEKWDVARAKAWVKEHSKGMDFALEQKWIEIEDEDDTDKEALDEMERFSMELELDLIEHG